VKHVDELMGTLEEDLKALHMPIDLIIVSDHGMEKIQGGWIDLDEYAPLDGLIAVGDYLYAPTEDAANAAYQKLKAADPAFMVYRRANVPAELHYSDNPREGDPIIVARGPYAIRAHAPTADGEDRAPTVGNHGFDPYAMPNMKAVFYAEGPDIRAGVKLKSFENVNVFPLLVKILGLDAPPVDGSLGVLSGVLTEQAQQ
jgi:alkaline phosphatase D